MNKQVVDEQVDEQVNELISTDIMSILDSLLIYKIAAKILSKDEISIVLNEGGKKFIEFFQDRFDISVMGPIVNDIIKNKKQLIISNMGDVGDMGDI